MWEQKQESAGVLEALDDDEPTMMEKYKELDLHDHVYFHYYLPRSEKQRERCYRGMQLEYPVVDDDALCSCDCTDGCRSEACSCKRTTWIDNKKDFFDFQTKRMNSHKKLFRVWGNDKQSCYKDVHPKNFPYRKGKLKEPIASNSPYNGHLSTNIIQECNKRCKCQRSTSKKCTNHVTQDGLQVKLAVFLTKRKGWGVRAEQFIERGTYLGCYFGIIRGRDKSNEAQREFTERIINMRYKKYEFDSSTSILGLQKLTNDFADQHKTEAKLAQIVQPTDLHSDLLDNDLDILHWLPENKPSHDGLNVDERRLIENEYSYVTEMFIQDSANCGTFCKFFNHTCGEATVFTQERFDTFHYRTCTHLVDTLLCSPLRALLFSLYNICIFSNHRKCVYDNRQDQRLPTLAFFAARDIEKGEELVWNYDLTTR